MPTKKKTGKSDAGSRKVSASKGASKTGPVEAGQASAGDSSRATKPSEKGSATAASKRARSANAGKPSPEQDATAKASTSGARRRMDPVSAVFSDAPPTHEQIAARAYELFAKSGYQDGHSEEHWLQAERELQREHAAKKRARGEQRPTFSSF